MGNTRQASRHLVKERWENQENTVNTRAKPHRLQARQGGDGEEEQAGGLARTVAGNAHSPG